MKNSHGFVRIACVSPELKLADIDTNTLAITKTAFEACNEGADIILFPELSLTGYTCADLFLQKKLRSASMKALKYIAESTADIPALIAVGLPVYHDARLYNCAAVISGGAIMGLVPKTYIPNYGEYYEARWFSSGSDSVSDSILYDGDEIPFGSDLLFKCSDSSGERDFTVGVEICEDMWAPIPPSASMALAGADVILNLSASNELAGKADYRRELISKLSGQYLCAYTYCSSGIYESTTDTVFGGHQIIAENGRLLCEGDRFTGSDSIIYADADIDFIEHERTANKTFAECGAVELGRGRDGKSYRLVECDFQAGNLNDLIELSPSNIRRDVQAHPFIPGKKADRTVRCSEIFSIQSSALASRLRHIGCRNVVIGLSGGLDSTLALLVIVNAFKRLGLPSEGIKSITMPGFGTTNRTKSNAEKLCETMGIPIEIIDITPACVQHFKDLGHDGITTDITYENTQARERTKILMNKSNQVGGIVIGTGDLSELAMGWCTYNGDHMSMYAVNTGVPKTLVRYLVEYYKDHLASAEAASVLADIIDTPISPELLPPDKNGEIAQKTEENIGPYELHDFFLYQVVRCGFTPSKTLFLAQKAFDGKHGINTYSRDEIKKWLRLFYRRFFSQQFKRSCIPDGPKVGTIALSPRADWRMPSDASVNLWLKELEEL